MTQDMAKPEGRTGKVIPSKEMFHKLLVEMEGLAELEQSQGTTGIGDSQIAAILGAASEQEMWDADELPRIGGRDIAKVEQELIDFAVKFGSPPTDDAEGITTIFVGPRTGKQMYLLIEATRISKGPSLVIPWVKQGDTFNWNTSAPLIVAKMFWLRHNGKLPGQRAVIEETPIDNGTKKVIKLKELSERVTSAKAETT